MLIFKWQRLIFILISLEFLMMRVFLIFSELFREIIFFYFIRFSVISRILGIIIIVGNIKFFGRDQCIF